MAGHDSCLAADQSGGARTPPLPDDPSTDHGVEVASLADAAEEMLSAAVAAPKVARYYQGRACTAMKRTKADIDQVVIHTPEGGESGTLSVLNGTGASFDWFLPLSGSLYRCNDYFNYVAWQAGHWETNLRSIGIEQGDYASRSGSFGDAHYRRLARLCAYLAETLDLKIVRARGIGQAGFVSHADITPGTRTDPGGGFLWDKLLDYTLDYRQGRTPGEKPAPKPTPGVLHRVRCGSFRERENADALVFRLKKAGFGALAISEDGAHNVYAGSFSVRANAEKLAAELRRKGFEAVVVQRGAALRPAPVKPTRPGPAEVLAFGRRLKGTPYGDGWKEGTWPDGPSLYARCNPKVHTVAYALDHEMICSALVNFIRAHLFGLPAVGRAQGDPYPGGTAAVMRTLARMKGSRPYVPGEIPPAGALLHADYLGPALSHQGHEMISTGDGKVLEARLPSVSDNRTAMEVHQHLVRTTGQGISRVIPFDVWTRA